MGRDALELLHFNVQPVISNHAPRMGRDVRHARLHALGLISIHAPRMGRDLSEAHVLIPLRISIHAPRMGRDAGRLHPDSGVSDISIHAPRMGRDSALPVPPAPPPVFQSTRPVWGATNDGGEENPATKFQSTRPVWGATI